MAGSRNLREASGTVLQSMAVAFGPRVTADKPGEYCASRMMESSFYSCTDMLGNCPPRETRMWAAYHAYEV